MDNFLKEFLLISDFKTVLFLCIFAILFFMIRVMSKKKVKFSNRILIAMLMGLSLGILIQVVSGFVADPMEVAFVKETTSWFSLIGNGFIDLIRMLVIPLVMVSVVHVIIHMDGQSNMKKLVNRSLITTMGMVSVAAVVGLTLGILFQLGSEQVVHNGEGAIKEVVPVVMTIRNLIPANPIEAMMNYNVVGLVIFAGFFGLAARKMRTKYEDIIDPFYRSVDALHKILISISMTIIKGMPYAVLALLANTVAQRGLASIMDAALFIFVLYLACVIMFMIQLLMLTFFQVNPIIYIKKSLSVLILSFTSRSSVSVLPATIETLTKKLGVNEGTASLVASFGTTAGMQGCAGLFPAMVLVYVANSTGVSIDISFLIISVLVITIGSVGIAGIPGTATMAASVSLSGIGMGASFPIITPILAIDPIIDMARTMLNVSGSMVNAIMVDRQMKQMDMEIYNQKITNDVESL